MKLPALAVVVAVELMILAAKGAPDDAIDRRPRLQAPAAPAPWTIGFLHQLHVSGSGSDRAAGTPDAPLRTMGAA